MSGTDVKDYLEEARGRVTEAFKEKPVFDKYLQLASTASANVQQTALDLYNKRWIDTAEGKQLDIIGDIVGQPRELIGADFYNFFGYQGNPQSKAYGTISDNTKGGYYLVGGQQTSGNIILDDDLYKKFIKAKIIKNKTRATPEDVIKFITFVFDVIYVWIVEQGDGKALIRILSYNFSQADSNLLYYFTKSDWGNSYFVPKSLGVSYEWEVIPANELFPGGPSLTDFLSGEELLNTIINKIIPSRGYPLMPIITPFGIGEENLNIIINQTIPSHGYIV